MKRVKTYEENYTSIRDDFMMFSRLSSSYSAVSWGLLSCQWHFVFFWGQLKGFSQFTRHVLISTAGFTVVQACYSSLLSFNESLHLTMWRMTSWSKASDSFICQNYILRYAFSPWSSFAIPFRGPWTLFLAEVSENNFNSSLFSVFSRV